MSVLRALIIAFSMFSRIPMPRTDWSGKNMRWMMAWFPFVGVAVGVAILLWNWGSVYLGFGPLLRGVGLAIVPLLVTGGIHLDGFCDTVDALASHGDREKKQAILKDPHAGAFAAMAVSAYLLGFAALGSELGESGRTVGTFALVFVLSRALSALAVVVFPCAQGGGLVRAFSDGAAKRGTGVLMVLTALLTMAAMVWLGGAAGVAAAAAALAVFAVYRLWLTGEFGGISGDLAGWFVQVCELCALGAMVVAGKLTA